MKITLNENKLLAVSDTGSERIFDFPAAAVSIGGRRIEARRAAGAPRKLADGSWTAEFAEDLCRFIVTVTPGGPGWFFKQVELLSDRELPTPDYIEVDRQQQKVANFACRGYIPSRVKNSVQKSDEEGHGIVPGCGYPLIGDDFFTGVEHPAAFNSVVSEENGIFKWQLRHFPVWQGKRILSHRAVIGMGNDAGNLFFDYLKTVRLPVLTTPLIAFCSFWSDPYQGNLEYHVNDESYVSLLEAFNKLDLRPDVYTLDAGWQDRNSFLRAKASYGGEQELIRFGEKVRASGMDLSLWVSPNGPVGISPDFLRSQGIAVGSGCSSLYSGDNFGVLLDAKLEKILTERICELSAPPYSVRHFKVDWDNECAFSPEFGEKYPTRDHVREASVNMMARINQAARAVNPRVLTRNGRWPSPWFLMLSSHVSLPDGGDCEFADLPSLDQRNSSITHRDLMYWCAFVRDKSVFPLDVFDNHEFAHSLRNPFYEDPGVWSDTCVWTVMRGTSYHQLALMPEALEDWQANILRSAMELLRKDTRKIITDRSAMFGGNPAAGDVYGFYHPGGDGCCTVALRNSSPMPREYVLPDHAPYYMQTYPDCRRFRAGEKVVFAPHEVKVLNGTQQECSIKSSGPFQLFPADGGRYQCYLPASCRPDVLKIHQIPELEKIHYQAKAGQDFLDLAFGVKTPWRMREFKLFFKVKENVCTAADMTLYTSRYASCIPSSYAVPITAVPHGTAGSGEAKNPETAAGCSECYFTADLPQGGEVFFRLTIKQKQLCPEDIELWVSGFEAPARTPECTDFSPENDWVLPLPHPNGFPRSLRLL